MALLRRVWHAGEGGGLSTLLGPAPSVGSARRALRLLAPAPLLLLLGVAAGCRDREEPNTIPPDALLVDSLGLTAEDRVHRIVLSSTNGTETVDPTEVAVEPGDFVEFVTQDRRVRTVSFTVDGLTPAQSSFLGSSGQQRSPPLVELETRFVVSFRDAPPGRYPFVVEGNSATIAGVVTVAAPEPER
jgi:plastocyanin